MSKISKNIPETMGFLFIVMGIVGMVCFLTSFDTHTLYGACLQTILVFVSSMGLYFGLRMFNTAQIKEFREHTCPVKNVDRRESPK